MKPTPKAATTVVSTCPEAAASGTSKVIRTNVSLEPGCVGWVRRRRRGPLPAPPAPAQRGERDCRRRSEERGDRDPVGGNAEPLRLGTAENAVSVLGHERGFDLRLRLALVYESDDERALALGLDRVGGLVERDAALEAHDLVLDGAEARARAGGRDGWHQEGQRRSHGSQPS